MSPREIIKKFCKENEIDEPEFYTKKAWRERGERYCNNAVLPFTCDGGDFYYVANVHLPGLFDELWEMLEAEGYYIEMAYSWMGGVYRL